MKKLTFLAILIFSISQLTAQRSQLKVPTLSPFAEAKQEVGLTTLELTYSRPSMKGRTVFGDLVPYGKIWRTGANASTKLTFSEDVKVGGKDLAAGTYALYTIPNQDKWAIIVHKNTKMRSLEGRYKKENDAFRFEVPVVQNPLAIETFTIVFADITTNGCNLRLSWENTIINIPIEVEVDAKIEGQMTELLKNPDQIVHATYFRAAEYYLHNNKNLEQALTWIERALTMSESNFRYGLLKAKIQAARGDKTAALTTIKLANKWANIAKNDNYISQTKLFWESLEGGN